MPSIGLETGGMVERWSVPAEKKKLAAVENEKLANLPNGWRHARLLADTLKDTWRQVN